MILNTDIQHQDIRLTLFMMQHQEYQPQAPSTIQRGYGAIEGDTRDRERDSDILNMIQVERI